jgi:hypothetical protein
MAPARNFASRFALRDVNCVPTCATRVPSRSTTSPTAIDPSVSTATNGAIGSGVSGITHWPAAAGACAVVAPWVGEAFVLLSGFTSAFAGRSLSDNDGIVRSTA